MQAESVSSFFLHNIHRISNIGIKYRVKAPLSSDSIEPTFLTFIITILQANDIKLKFYIIACSHSAFS